MADPRWLLACAVYFDWGGETLYVNGCFQENKNWKNVESDGLPKPLLLVTEPRKYPILFTLFGLNRAGQILYAVVIVAAFLWWTDVFSAVRFSAPDEQLFRAAKARRSRRR